MIHSEAAYASCQWPPLIYYRISLIRWESLQRSWSSPAKIVFAGIMCDTGFEASMYPHKNRKP